MTSDNPVKQQATHAAHELASISNKEPLAGFKQFISRGSMVDMAVGVVMGSAVTAVVNSIVKNLLSPLIAMIFGKPDLSGLLTISNGKATISFGAILGEILNFLLVAAAIYFCVILPMNKIRDLTRTAAGVGDSANDADSKPSTDEQTVELLQSILTQMQASETRVSYHNTKAIPGQSQPFSAGN
ncbi:large conductance mechanosensitive channel protein MscL [Bombiscardovia apis]|uniref:Large-conductance mechanosensitive channel n=1 Tax=Bombiscardovia apis TaxID=2932182 RepID=A0ABM8BE62_9BIFI|nr:large conductance mechanosensitive channel protein MscL [Bombiscardovia apis]BDR55186.1 large conductance mechanosensitive channel protein MscL [Bombiscardovia apis]